MHQNPKLQMSEPHMSLVKIIKRFIESSCLQCDPYLVSVQPKCGTEWHKMTPAPHC